MINHPLPLDVGLQIEIWLTEVQQEALPEEIFDRLGSEYLYSVGEDAPELPNAIYIKLDAKPDNTEARTATLPMIKELSEAPLSVLSVTSASTKRTGLPSIFTCSTPNVSHATTNMKYGIEAITKQPYKIFEYRAKGLGKYFKQYFGKMRRQALLEQIAENLGEAPHFLAASWGMHWYVPNVENWNQPVYSTSYQTFTNSIVAALTAAGTGQNAAGTVVYFQRLEEWARTEVFVNTLDFEDGTNGYVVLLPTPTARWMKNPTTGFPTLGALYTDSSKFSKEVHFMFPGFIGQIGCLRFVEDPRYPTLTLGGSASGSAGAGAGYSMTAQYRGMGRADDGSSDPRDKSATARLVGFLLGKGCLCEWMPEGFHWEWEYEQYDKYFGSGIFMSVGIRNPMYNFTDGTSANVQQDNCIILPFAQPPQLV